MNFFFFWILCEGKGVVFGLVYSFICLKESRKVYEFLHRCP